MKKLFLTLLLISVLAAPAFGQYAYRIVPRASNPATCSPFNGEVLFNTTNLGLYQCTATDTWTSVGTLNNSFTLAQGTLTADNPAIDTTATWNNAAVTFTNWFSNVTDTASNAASLLVDLQVGGVSQFELTKGGSLTIPGNFSAVTGTFSGDVFAGAAQNIGFTGQSIAGSSADGYWNISNAAGTGLTLFTLGPESVAGTGIVPDVVGGQTQGVIIGNGDGTTLSFAELAAATDGAIVYCDDCTKATPCAGGGTGALAKRYNGAWDCD